MLLYLWLIGFYGDCLASGAAGKRWTNPELDGRQTKDLTAAEKAVPAGDGGSAPPTPAGGTLLLVIGSRLSELLTRAAIAQAQQWHQSQGSDGEGG